MLAAAGWLLAAAPAAFGDPDWARPPAPDSTPVGTVVPGSAAAPVTLPPAGRELAGFSDAAAMNYPSQKQYFGAGLTSDVQAGHAADAGMDSQRIVAAWQPHANANRTPPQWDEPYFERLDAFVTALNARGIKPLLISLGAPAWAAEGGVSGGGIADRPDAIAGFATHVKELVVRFRGRIAGIETWNEPNLTLTWSNSPVSSAPVYARAHAAAHDALVAAGLRDDVKLIFGSLAPAERTTAGKVFWAQQYLLDAYAAGLRPWHYDAISFHPYPGQYGSHVSDWDAEGSLFNVRWNDIMKALRWAHDGKLPRLWLTELGVTTSGCGRWRPTPFSDPFPACPGEPTPNGCGGVEQPPCDPEAPPVSRSDQRDEVIRMLRKLFDHPKVEAVFVHRQYEAHHYTAWTYEKGFGAMIATPSEDRSSTTFQPKPLYCGLVDLHAAAPPVTGC